MTQVQFLFCHKGVQTYLPFPRLICQANYFCGPNSIPSHERIFKSLCPFNPHLPWERSKSGAVCRSCDVLCDLFKSLVLLCLREYKTCWLGAILRGALPVGPNSIAVDVMPYAPLCSTEVTWKKSLQAVLLIQYCNAFRAAITMGYSPRNGHGPWDPISAWAKPIFSNLKRTSVGICLIISHLKFPPSGFYSHRLQFRGCGFSTRRTSIAGFIMRNSKVMQDCQIKHRKTYCFRD